ncbi:T6SS immunity protein Tli4 family protein [Ralstonia pseudosolanacearum]|uniref:T6SS immunity protein Tli4 family protein n=1 Tax=Ralstonia pseudosolanacearum TaxID=1310165 RepID=UPI003CEA4A91
MREQVSHAGWKTFCFGRYLVDLPQQAKVSAVYKIRGKNIEFVLGEEPAKLKSRIDRREAELRTARHETSGAMFVRRIPLNNGSEILFSWSSPYSKVMLRSDVYLVAAGAARVFRYGGDVSTDRENAAIQNAADLAANIQSLADKKIPVEPGFCIDKGFIAGSDYRSEGFQVGITLPQHPNALITIDASTGAEQDRLLERVDKFFATAVAAQLSGLKILRKRQRDVGPIEAEEYATAASGNGQRVYAFAWESQGKDKSLSEQNIVAALKVLEQSVITEHTPYRPAFKSDEEALQLWDTIIDSIRLRPGAVQPMRALASP